MFDLDKAITVWRKQISTAGIRSKEVLDELENHLRDEIERQMQAGADEEHAYEAAVACIGQPAAVGTEFAKLKATVGWPRFLKMCYLLFIPCMLLINFWTLLEYELSLLQRILGLSAVSVICLYLASLPYLLRSLTLPAYFRLAKLIKAGFLLLWLWPVWALLEAEHVVHFELSIVWSTVLWCLYAAAAFSGFALGLHEGYRRGGAGGLPPPPWSGSLPISPTRPTAPDLGATLPRLHTLDSNASEALKAATEEALRLGHDFIGTEHVLLGVLKRSRGALPQVLQKLRLDSEALRMEIERSVSVGPTRSGGIAGPLTPRARKALQLAGKEAKRMNQPRIGTEHIFLGLLHEGSGVAGQVLRKLGIRMKRAREEVFSEFHARPNC
jgi:hypothetical protein